MAEDDTLNCPDCQMQLLQQQNCEMPMEVTHPEGNSSVNVSVSKNSGPDMQIIRTPTSHWEPLMSTMNRIDTHHRNPEEDGLYCSNGRPIGSMGTGNGMGGSGISYTTSSSYSSSTNVVLGPSTPTYSSSTTSCDLVSNGTPCLTPIPEGCSGYCATCAVLELPSNECYYRAPLTRHAVYPPIFYNQPPPLPGFSPIPECSPWGGCNSNDFPPFSFPPYSQPATVTDYFSSSGIVNTHPTSTADQNNFIDSSSANLYSSTNARVEFTEQKNKINDKVNENVQDTQNLPSCSSSEDSSCSDSESLISQKELIVEDDESVSVSICNFDRNQKCILCQNPIVSDCSSPHLDNILENIDEEIDDLDITVSSADIEIGGIEDEVRCFHQKKISANSSAMHISLDRLAQFIGISSQSFRHENKNNHIDLNLMSINEYSTPEEQMVLLCSKCGKLALLADSLEKQLNNTIHLLQESSYKTLTTSRPVISKDLNESPSKDRMINFEMYPTPSASKHNIDLFSAFKEFDTSKQPLSEKQAITIGTQTSLSGSMTHNILEIENVSVSKNASEINKEPAMNPEKFNTVMDMLPFSTNESTLITNLDPENPSTQTINDLFNENISAMDSTNAIQNVVSKNSNIVSIHTEDLQNVIENPQTHSEIHNNKKDIPTNEDNTLSVLSNLDTTKENETSFRKNCAKETEFMCDVCGKLLSTKRSLLQHLLRHENGNQFNTETQNIKILMNENSSHKHKLDQIDPAVSDKGTPSQATELLTNPLVHKNKYNCCTCGLTFRTKNRLEKHALKNCETESIRCEFCDRRFSKISEMKVHLRVHAGQKPFCCDVCGLAFATKGNQVAHSKTHSDTKLFMCHICTKGFNRKMALQFHLNRHNGTRPYSCPKCNLSFYDPSNLSNHTKKVH